MAPPQRVRCVRCILCNEPITTRRYMWTTKGLKHVDPCIGGNGRPLRATKEAREEQQDDEVTEVENELGFNEPY